MTILVTGSLAYDRIMVFPDQFKNHILPQQLHILNVCFLVPELRQEFGGCAGNIAYNLHLLGEHPLPMATVGMDFAPYHARLQQLGLACQHITEIPDTYTAQAFVTTDTDNNQIIAFHPGAMNFSHHNKISDAPDITLGIVAPDGRMAMLEHAAQFAAARIPFFFDPGQGLPMFTADELNTFIAQANYVCVNDYESAVLMEKTGRTTAELAAAVEALIITRGGDGADIYYANTRLHIPPLKPTQVVDPTGCGDAFRAGLLYGIRRGWNWQTSGQLATLLGGIKIAQAGTQNHTPSRAELVGQYRENFGEELVLA